MKKLSCCICLAAFMSACDQPSSHSVDEPPPRPYAEAWYSFEVESEGLPPGAYWPPPKVIDVRYWDVAAKQWVNELNVDADWAIKQLELKPGDVLAMVATAEGGGPLMCSVEITYPQTARGETWYGDGKHSCRVRTKVTS